MISDETRARQSAAQRRRYEDPAERARASEQALRRVPVSDEARAKMSAAHRRRAVSGEETSNWRGDAVSYSGAHFRARNALAGQPCAHADDTCKGRMEVAFKHDTPPEFVKDSPSGYYSPRTEDYMMLCSSHHRRFDHNPREMTSALHSPPTGGSLTRSALDNYNDVTRVLQQMDAAGEEIARIAGRLQRVPGQYDKGQVAQASMRVGEVFRDLRALAEELAR